MVKNAISIEPYFDAEIPNMGFEKYGLSMAPGAEVTEYISKDINGRYITGLDLNTPEIMYLEDKEEKVAIEKEIKDVIKRLEQVFGNGVLDARNSNFWGEFYLKFGHTGKSLDPANPRDELAYYAIKAGGFDAIAPNLEKAREDQSDRGYKFYLRQIEKDADLKVQRAKTINKAKAALTDLDEEDPYKLLMVAKNILAPNNEFTEKTPKSLIYDKLDQFIDGKIVKDNKKLTVKHFLDAYNSDIESLYRQALVKDALYFNVIIREADGYFYNKQTETRLGKNEKEIVKHLENPINELEFENIKSRVEGKFNK